MPDNKHIDEILNEYANDEDNQPSKPVPPPDTLQNTGCITIPDSAKTIGNTAVYSPEQVKALEELLKRPNPSHQSSKFAVSDVNRPNVSYINSVTEVRKTSADLPPRPTDEIDGYDGAVMITQPPDETYVPKVRKMSNSTRAKEMRAKRRKKNKKKKIDFTYAVESPDGIYTKPEKKSKKFVIQRQTDDNIDNTPVYDDNIIPLSEQSDPNALDIKIVELETHNDYDNDETENKSRKKRHSKSYDKKKTVKDYDSFEDAGEIRRGISEVKENISFRVVVMFVMMIVSCYSALGEFIGVPVPPMLSRIENPLAYCGFQLIILLLSALISFNTVKNGIISLLTFRADSDSLSMLTFITTTIATVAAGLFTSEAIQNGDIYIYTPITVFGFWINALGKKLILNRMEMNFRYISKDDDAHAILCVEDDDVAESLTRGTIGDFPILATMRKTNFIKDFAKYTYSSDTGDRYSRILSPIIIIFSLLLASAVTFLRIKKFDYEAIAFGLFIFAASVSACSCITIPLIANIPLEKASKKYVKNRGIMLGYQSVDDFYDTNSVMVSADTFFPTGSISLASIKLFSGAKIENAIHEAASLAVHGNSVLQETFCDMLADKNIPLSRVESFVYEDSMGLCGWINNKRVLLGNRELMHNHKIEGIPTMTKEKEFTDGEREAIYLSVSGNLMAMFIIEISASKAIVKSMQQLAKQDIAVLVRTVDPFITIRRLASMFNYSDELIKIIPQRLIKDFEQETQKVKKVSASMACSGKFNSFIQLIMGTKLIRKTVVIGITLQLIAMLLGFVLVSITTILNSIESISPHIILGYQIIVTLLITIVVKIRKI